LPGLASHHGQQQLPVLKKKSADCRSFTLPRLAVVWWFRVSGRFFLSRI
jgi:hypothetical protein